MVSQSLTTAQSSTNHHKEQKRNGLKTSAKHSGLIFIHQKKKKRRRSSEGSRKPLLGTGSTWRAWLCAGLRARPRITGSVGASYLYFTGEMACVAEVATASTDYGQSECKKPAKTQATLGVKAALVTNGLDPPDDPSHRTPPFC